MSTITVNQRRDQDSASDDSYEQHHRRHQHHHHRDRHPGMLSPHLSDYSLGQDVDLAIGVTATALTGDQLLRAASDHHGAHRGRHLIGAGLGAVVAAGAFALLKREHDDDVEEKRRRETRSREERHRNAHDRPGERTPVVIEDAQREHREEKRQSWGHGWRDAIPAAVDTRLSEDTGVQGFSYGSQPIPHHHDESQRHDERHTRDSPRHSEDDHHPLAVTHSYERRSPVQTPGGDQGPRRHGAAWD